MKNRLGVINLYSITTVQGAEVVNVKTLGGENSVKNMGSTPRALTNVASNIELNSREYARKAIRRMNLEKRAASHHGDDDNLSINSAQVIGTGGINDEIAELIKKQKEEFKSDYEKAKLPLSKISAGNIVPKISKGDSDENIDSEDA